MITWVPKRLSWLFKLQLGDAAGVMGIILSDIVAYELSFLLAYFTRLKVLPLFYNFNPPDLPVGMIVKSWWMPILVIGSLTYEGLYSARLPYWREWERLIKSLTLAFLVILAIVSLGKLSSLVSRTVLVITWLFSLLILPALRKEGKILLAKVGAWRRKVIILGAGKTGELVLQAIDREPTMGYEVIGFLEDDTVKCHKVLITQAGKDVGVLGRFDDAEGVMERTKIRHLIIAAPGVPGLELTQLINRLQRKASSILVILDLFGIPLMGIDVDYFFDEQAVVLKVRNNLSNPWNIIAKRTFDLVVSIIILLISLPIMVLIAIAIVLESKGPIIFAHTRIGRGGKEFKCYKFRTMVINAQQVLEELLQSNPALRKEWEQNFKIKNDPRVTKVGKFLRKTSLDELPQILNVLKGDMSLVGPRPIVKREMKKFSGAINYYLEVRPGITGLWQINGRNDTDYETRVNLESWYVRNWSLWLDISLLLRTAGVVLKGEGAY